ncbi:nucleotide-binding domain-containing protein [Hyaloscypha bicolor E]|uniref:Nucleotide-binding domain-containing protein n=1 Tax=Hyaloscypha bicolor E TaxID=1095630 RepID=A0A2J6T7M6_9HELO|nr:nucleotide-binding domain-containing protein [Hyaloscypha bicolor E]PMD59022.1 nucleotide-binding domain-containing protein [Hyaloscypha bicolor E]
MPQKHITILGAGITGLTTALKLNSDPSAQYHITLIASHYPGDESIDYTSPKAGADWSPQATSSPADAEMREYDKNVVKDFAVLDLEKEDAAPEGAVMGVRCQTICLDVPQHLQYLLEKVREAGVNVIRSVVDVSHGLEGVVQDAKRIAMESTYAVQDSDVFALVNCTGLGARHFVGEEEAAKLFPIRGQTITVKGEAAMDRTYDDFPPISSSIDDENELTYVIPRPGSGTTIFGGCKQVGNWDPKVDEELNGRMVERIKKWRLAEELRTGKEGDFEVVSSQVGLRPGRKGGPRVEIEGKEKVDGVWVVHSYGHAGAGYQSSVGCSEKVAKIVNELARL